MENDDILKTLRSLEELDNILEDRLPRLGKQHIRKKDKDTGLLIYDGRKVTDHYRLDIERRHGEWLKTIDVSIMDKLHYWLTPKGRKQRLLNTNLYPKYLKEKEEKLEEMVARDNIASIKETTEKTYDIIKNLGGTERKEVYGWKKDKNREEKPNIIIPPWRKEITHKTDISDRINQYKEKKDIRRLFVLFDNNRHNNEQKFKEEIAYQINRYFGDTKSRFLEYIPLISVECEKNSITKVFDYINKNKIVPSALRQLNIGNICHVEYDQVVFLPELVLPDYKRISNDDMQWNQRIIGLEEAHLVTKGRGSTVGIIDTGVDYTHSELVHCFDPDDLGYDFVNDCNDPMDQEGHGTHVSGTVAGEYTGVAPAASLYGIRVLDSNGMGSLFDVMSGVEWAMTKNLDVINLSLGSEMESSAEEELYKAAHRMGMCICAAAGNDGDSRYNYPAAYDGVMSVAAVDRHKVRAYFSNANDMNDIAAPGVDIRSSVPNNGYELYNGTSMATPHISGVCALARSLNKESNDEIEKKIKGSAEKLGSTEEYGAGLVRADLLVKMYQQMRR